MAIAQLVPVGGNPDKTVLSHGVAQVFDEDGKNRTYGFVDYVTPEGAQMAMQQKSILMPPGQYIKVSNHWIYSVSQSSLQK